MLGHPGKVDIHNLFVCFVKEEEEDEEGSKKELVLTVLTIKELRDAVHRHIYGPHSVAFNFEGAESLDEIIPQIFTYEQQRGGKLL